MSAAFGPDAKRVVTASTDKTARVWDAASGKPPASPLKHRKDVVRAVFSPDGARVVTASGDGTARVWDAASGKSLSPPLHVYGRVVSAGSRNRIGDHRADYRIGRLEERPGVLVGPLATGVALRCSGACMARNQRGWPTASVSARSRQVTARPGTPMPAVASAPQIAA
jgi:hypothetical protein